MAKCSIESTDNKPSQQAEGSSTSVWQNFYRESPNASIVEKQSDSSEVPSADIEEDGSINFEPSPIGERVRGIKEAGGKGLGDAGEEPSPETETTGSDCKNEVLLVEEEYQKLADEQQLEVRKIRNGCENEYQFYTEIDGVQQTVLETSDSPNAIKDQLRIKQDEFLNRIEQAYNVDVAETGETTKSYDEKRDITLVTPTVGELNALDLALRNSVPDTDTVSGKPLRIAITEKDQDFGVLGVARDDKEIVMDYAGNLSYLKEVIVHEVSHIGQVERYAEQGDQTYGEALGWSKVDGEWLMRGSDGSYWKNVPQDNNEPDKWMRTDANGNPADENGVRTDAWWNPYDHGESSAQFISNDAMFHRAKVRPFSDYIANPDEMGAAMITPFRNNRNQRAELYKVSTETYDIAKQLDQQQIDAQYGTENGQPRLIRNPDGILVLNNEENRQIVIDYERGLAG